MKNFTYEKLPAKTYTRDDGKVVFGQSVLSHCTIVGKVANEIISRYPKGLQKALFPEGAPLAAACHDIGKVSPTFYNKISRACGVEQIPEFSPDLESEWGGHAGVSQATAKDLNAPKFLPEILGQHHGFSPKLGYRNSRHKIFGGELWQEQRSGLVEELKSRLKMDWPAVGSYDQARLVAGLTSVSDWIGSGKHFENPEHEWEDKITTAVSEAGYVTPTYKEGLSFEKVFGFSPRPVQAKLISVVNEPGVYVLEAPMGVGKTEAALYAAYRMLERGAACGVYFALPTQLTSNKIYDRFNEFLGAILEVGCEHSKALLLHGAAWLQDTEMGEEGRPGGAWFNQSKRGLLAPFAVGTIDQALMAVMNVKHGFVRAFGLAGKVVILDEVHSYDTYTGTLLDSLVQLLIGLNCTVIILSATLSQSRRKELVGGGKSVSSNFYPLITSKKQGDDIVEYPVDVGELSQDVDIKIESDDKSAITESLARAESGQQVLWIENTVGEAQERYLDLASRAADLGIECGLLHSRFTVSDRAIIEANWVSAFGKSGWKDRARKGRILVGTQVLEQSLDIDADFMVSRFAPTDMLLQRIGRLWRHTETPRAKGARCEVWILAPKLSLAIANAKKEFGPSAYVYSQYILCRSLEVWEKRVRVKLPEDMRDLIEATYSERQEEEDAMARYLYELENGTTNPKRKGRRGLRQMARIGLSTISKTEPESKAQTRYSESDTLDVLLIKNIVQLPGKNTSKITLLDGSELFLPHKRHMLNKREWKRITQTLMKQIVAIRPSRAPTAISRDVLEKYGFQGCFYLGDPSWVEDESILRVAMVDDVGLLAGIHGSNPHEKYLLSYRNDLGYQWRKSGAQGF